MQQSTSLSTPSWGQELRATLGLAVPLAATNLLQMLIHAVDVIFIARLGDQPLAASSLAIAIFGLTVWAMTGLVGACAPLIAAERGRRLHRLWYPSRWPCCRILSLWSHGFHRTHG
jgi:MATE family multidrug resistance protein